MRELVKKFESSRSNTQAKLKKLTEENQALRGQPAKDEPNSSAATAPQESDGCHYYLLFFLAFSFFFFGDNMTYLLPSFQDFVDPSAALNDRVKELEAQVAELNATRATLLQELSATEEVEEAKDAQIVSLEAALKEANAKQLEAAKQPNNGHLVTSLEVKVGEQGSTIELLQTQLAESKEAAKVLEQAKRQLEESAAEKSRQLEAQVFTLESDTQSLRHEREGLVRKLEEERVLARSVMEEEKAAWAKVHDASREHSQREAQTEIDRLKQAEVEVAKKLEDQATNAQKDKDLVASLQARIQVPFPLHT